MQPSELACLDFPSGYTEKIEAFFDTQRQSLLKTGTALTKARDGVVPDNPFDSSVSFRPRPSSTRPRLFSRY
jgi:hypothetical protein